MKTTQKTTFRLTALAAALLAALVLMGAVLPAYAQTDFSGEWAAQRHEDDEDRVEEIADPRRMLPTAAEANAGIDELIAVMSAGGNNDKLETLEKSFGSMELLTSGKGMAGLDAMRRRRMTMGASDRGDADIWRGRPPKKESPTFKSMIKPPPEAVQRALDECRREADSTERVKAAMKAMGRADQPASGLIGLPEVYQKVQASVAGGAWEFGEEVALDVLVADGDTVKCRCGKIGRAHV